jgi:quaternary ammonium compound-resistance protein SugE
MQTSSINWLALIAAGLFEVVWAIFLKNSKGFTVVAPSIFFVVTLLISMSLLAFAMRSIPLGVAYPIWTGIGAVGSIIVGVILFKEDINLQKLVFLAFILVGIIGLKITSKY